MSDEILDLLVVGAGPTGIATGAEARREGLSVLLVDRGPITAAIQEYPTFLQFFTTRDRLEIAGIPFAIPEDKPTRREVIAYYSAVAARFQIPLALYEEVTGIRKEGDLFRVESHPAPPHASDRQIVRRARAVVIATGYWGNPKRLGVPGEDLPWVSSRYKEPYPHFEQDVVIVGAGNTAAEAALDIWRNGGRVTLVHRGAELRPGIKYWLKPDIENRIAEGSIQARMNTVVTGFGPRGVEVRTPNGPETLRADTAYVLIGYLPDADFERRAGIQVDPETLVPQHDPETCETNVPGLYIAGTIQAGRRTDQIFIENSRDHGPKIVAHLKQRLAAHAGEPVPA